MNFYDLYNQDNAETINTISWINKNRGFDTSTGKFKEPDLFTFLENINNFDYSDNLFYDDFYYQIYKR